MPLVVSEDGEKLLLDDAIAGVLSNLQVHLYKNDISPIETDGLLEFEEADYSGYAPESVVGNWSAAAVEGNYATTANDTPVEFSHDGGGTANTIYGYFVTTNLGAILVYSEKFEMPAVMENLDDKIIITLKFSSRSEFGQVP